MFLERNAKCNKENVGDLEEEKCGRRLFFYENSVICDEF